MQGEFRKVRIKKPLAFPTTDQCFYSTTGARFTSYLLAFLSVFVVLRFSLLPAVLAGLTVHVLTSKLARRIPAKAGSAHRVALAIVASYIGICFCVTVLNLWSLATSTAKIEAFLTIMADTLGNLRQMLPAGLAIMVPSSVAAFKIKGVGLLQEYGHQGVVFGLEGLKVFAHVLLGGVIGGLTALKPFNYPGDWPPLAAMLHQRLKMLAEAFEKVVFAQVKISGINTILTAVYLAVLIPLCSGQRVPMTVTLIVFTFLAGLIPIAGNIVSNAAIVVVGMSMSPIIGAISLGFLVGIHKLEYFINARIVGCSVKSSAWELLCSMTVMEAVFGPMGLVAAPVVYAWLKAELRKQELV